ncbi:hypothetical protein [Isoptericola sp. b408]|uniref:hypothetical protein n=1 Tax=Isoptericola sp. b408 TaxID=3064653 RepID=UPI0027143D20|nr:hypothetical protein [Isoptericola sp. b408]MDO8152294.1 hypothetical protein [Isoptericola sp. b408]
MNRFVTAARSRRGIFALAAVGMAVVSGVLAAAAVASPRPWLVFAAVVGFIVATGLSTAVVGTWLIARSERRITRRIDRVESSVEGSRAKASRHEYHQEQSLERLERKTREVAATTAGLAWFAPRSEPDKTQSSTAPHVLFVTSNGGGMGHIARCSAVLRHSGEQLTGRILTLSTAGRTVRDAGFDVDSFPSPTASGESLPRWRRQFMRRLLHELSERPADVVVFDGTWVFPVLTDVAEYVDVPLVWLRRGLWRQDADLTQVEEWREHVDAVVVPGDLAETRETALAPFRDATWTDPVSLAPGERTSRDSALTALGLEPSKKYALVQLSGGNSDGSATTSAVEAIKAAGDVVPVVVRSPLLSPSVATEAVSIESRFPLVDLSAAWEFTVTQAGYNSVHENLHTATPGIYLPSASTLMDDQHRRARGVAQAGLGLIADGENDLGRVVADLADRSRADDIRGAIRERNLPQGAPAAARAIANVLAAR